MFGRKSFHLSAMLALAGLGAAAAASVPAMAINNTPTPRRRASSGKITPQRYRPTLAHRHVTQPRNDGLDSVRILAAARKRARKATIVKRNTARGAYSNLSPRPWMGAAA